MAKTILALQETNTEAIVWEESTFASHLSCLTCVC